VPAALPPESRPVLPSSREGSRDRAASGSCYPFLRCPGFQAACQVGCGEAGTELLIGHGAFLRRDDFSAFICEGTSIADGETPMASIDWETAIAARSPPRRGPFSRGGCPGTR
jgi:hypothetical protein